jgi:hypothetical protein
VVTVTGQGISSITDSSGNGNTATQTSDTRRMLYGASTLNGKLVANTNNETRFLDLPSDFAGWTTDAQPPHSALAVVRLNSYGANLSLFEWNNSAQSQRFSLRTVSSGGSRFQFRTPAASSGIVTVLSTETTIASGVTYLLEGYAAGGGGAFSLTINEGTPATGTGSAVSGETFTVQRISSLNSPPNALIACVYFFNAVLSGPERTEWRAFLKSRWGYA